MERKNEEKEQIREAVRDYWDLRANGFSSAVDEELETAEYSRWEGIFTKELDGYERVLDDGCGPGFFGVILSRLGHSVCCIDYSEDMVKSARQRMESLGLDAGVIRMDAHELDFDDGSFDAVVSRNVLWNLQDPAKAYEEICRVLRPGGKLIVSDGNMYRYLFDEKYKVQHDRMLKEHAQFRGGLHGKHNTDNVDFSIIERIAGELPMPRVQRPQWDIDRLIWTGFDEFNIKISGGDLPGGFLLIAKKKEV